MSSMVVSGLAFAFVDAEPLFEGVELHLGEGWYGLVGANGAGKTTLLRLLAGSIAPDGGRVRLEPEDATVEVCPQLVDALGDSVRAFAVDGTKSARALRGRLALDPDALERWETLSPGERKRWQIGAALAAEPDVLLLDEPTNHLDAEARALLVAALARFPGVGVVVSHDRPLLEALTAATIRIDRRQVSLHPGSYAVAREAWEREAAAAHAKRDKLVDASRAAAKKLARARAARAEASHDLSAGRRMKNPHDHDANDGLANFRVESAEARLARSVAVARAGASRAAAAVPAFEVDATLGRSVFVGYAPPPRPRLLALDGDVVVAGTKLLAGVHLAIGRGERVRIEGPNGAGKTLLLARCLDAAGLPPDRVLLVPQEIAEDDARAALDRVRDLPPDARGRTLSLVAALGVDPDRVLVSSEPSPGEAKKLLVAEGLARHVWLAVLDEPTNHLDLPSIERLERALAAFPGVLVVVTHDPTFLAGTFSRALRVADGVVRELALVRDAPTR